MFLTFLHKELRIELRQQELTSSALALGLVLAILSGFAVHSCMLESSQIKKLFPALIWIVFASVSAFSLSKSHDNELDNRAIDAVLLSSASISQLYLAKCALAALIIFFAHLLSTGVLSLLINQPIGINFIAFAQLSLLVAIGMSAIGTLIGAVTSTARLKGILLPLILLPLSLPLLFAALELTHTLFATGTLDTTSFWFSLLLGLDLVYSSLGLTLFEEAVRE